MLKQETLRFFQLLQHLMWVVINPQLCEAQIEEELFQGLGSALWEELVLEKGGL